MTRNSKIIEVAIIFKFLFLAIVLLSLGGCDSNNKTSTRGQNETDRIPPKANEAYFRKSELRLDSILFTVLVRMK